MQLPELLPTRSNKQVTVKDVILLIIHIFWRFCISFNMFQEKLADTGIPILSKCISILMHRPICANKHTFFSREVYFRNICCNYFPSFWDHPDSFQCNDKVNSKTKHEYYGWDLLLMLHEGCAHTHEHIDPTISRRAVEGVFGGIAKASATQGQRVFCSLPTHNEIKYRVQS